MPRRSTGSRALPLSFCPTRCQVPVRSTWANAGVAAITHEIRTANRKRRMASPPRRTGGRVPSGAVRFLLEERRRESRVAQILRIVELRRDREPLLTIRALVEIPVLGHDSVLAVGNAVLPQVSRAKILGDDLQRSAGWTNRRRIRGAIRWSQLQRHVRPRHPPLRLRDALPGARCIGGRLDVAESKESRLRARVALDLERCVILPGDMKPPRDHH